MYELLSFISFIVFRIIKIKKEQKLLHVKINAFNYLFALHAQMKEKAKFKRSERSTYLVMD